MKRRGSGILLHITSLPARFGIGDLGPAAYRFADFLVESGQSYWQILPLNPTDPITGDSPYCSASAFAGNPLLISPEVLLEQGLISDGDIDSSPDTVPDRIDFQAVVRSRQRVLDAALPRVETFLGAEFERFCAEQADWLENYALFIALKHHFGGQVWSDWPPEYRDRHQDALDSIRDMLGDRIEREKRIQFLFYRQWSALKRYCNRKGIRIIGDIPIYVQFDSVDVWTNPEIFKLDDAKQPIAVTGVPPDYFSSTGQLWGHPVYNWDILRETGFNWWLRRMEHVLNLYDVVRIDHFRGLVAYWEVPAGEQTAVNGVWVKVPVHDFMQTLLKRFFSLHIIAEDLGYITPDVREIMYLYGLPGMKVLLFAFGDDIGIHSYIPHNLERNCVIYTGTHDMNTASGWYAEEASEGEKDRLARYVGQPVSHENVHRQVVRLAMMSVANTAIIPMQDFLGLGESARMNHPATGENNWRWRLREEELSPACIHEIRDMTELYGRL